MKREYAELFVAIVLIIISAFPLFDILSNIDSTINVSAFSLAIIVIMLIVVLFSSIIYFISYWTDKFNQLHFKGAVYTVPEIYQVRGLHNSSSLYKITNWWWSMVKSQGHTRIFSPNSIHWLSWQSNRFLIYGSWVRVPYVSQQMIP